MKTPYVHTPPRNGDNTYLRRERDRRRRRELVLLTLAVLPLGLGLLVFTWVRLETLAVGYRISELEHRLHQMERRRQELELKVDDLSRPDLVEKLAVEELSMVSQSHRQTLYYEALR